MDASRWSTCRQYARAFGDGCYDGNDRRRSNFIYNEPLLPQLTVPCGYNCTKLKHKRCEYERTRTVVVVVAIAISKEPQSVGTHIHAEVNVTVAWIELVCVDIWPSLSHRWRRTLYSVAVGCLRAAAAVTTVARSVWEKKTKQTKRDYHLTKRFDKRVHLFIHGRINAIVFLDRDVSPYSP